MLALLFLSLLAFPRYGGSSEVQLFSGRAVSVRDLWPESGPPNLWPDEPTGAKEKSVAVPSPNGKKKLIFPGDWVEKDDTVAYTFFAAVGQHQYPIHIDGHLSPLVIWAKDSSGVLFSFSDGGANCCYETKLISFNGEHVSVIDPTAQIAHDFISYRDKLGIKCKLWPHEYPNLFPIGWLDRSHAFIAAETVHHSNCDCWGSFRAYEIELPSGRIVNAINQPLAKKMFDGNLPWDLSEASNDDWDTNPKSCRPPDNQSP
jgi:hypothetical protein